MYLDILHTGIYWTTNVLQGSFLCFKSLRVSSRIFVCFCVILFHPIIIFIAVLWISSSIYCLFESQPIFMSSLTSSAKTTSQLWQNQAKLASTNLRCHIFHWTLPKGPLPFISCLHPGRLIWVGSAVLDMQVPWATSASVPF